MDRFIATTSHESFLSSFPREEAKERGERKNWKIKDVLFSSLLPPLS
jgi:hypothetical protein